MRNRVGRLSRRDAERMLEDPAASGSALGTTLSAAAGPARPAELRGEDAAVAAFHAARLATPPAARDHYVSPTRLAGRATARLVVAAGAVLALGTGGLAVATGVDLDDLPGLIADSSRWAAGSSDDPTSEGPASPGSTSPTPDDEQGGTPGTGDESDGGTSGDPEGDGSPHSRPDDPSSPDDPGSAEPDPQAARVLERACKDVLNPGRELGHDDHLATLVERAGGADQVEAFCTDLLSAKPDTPAKPEKPGKPEKPAKPVKPVHPTKPDKPGKPDAPGKPDKPGKPDAPGKPDQAGKPGRPDQAGKPGKPDQAGKPGKPDKPAKPGKPDQPGKPDKPQKPEKRHASGEEGPMTPG